MTSVNLLYVSQLLVPFNCGILFMPLFFVLQVTDFTGKVNFYVMNAVTFFKSMWAQVKANAALFVGKQGFIQDFFAGGGGGGGGGN